MAPSDRPGSAVVERARAGAHAWSFFQLVRVLTREAGAVPPGGPGPARAESVRLRPSASLGFATSDVASVEPLPRTDESEPERWQVTVNFMGLYGPASPMPNHFTEDILWSGGDEDAGRDFVDLFHHRVISFLYRAWEKYRFPMRFARDGSDEFSSRARSLFGFGTAGLEPASGLSAVALMRTAGLLADRHRSAAGLEGFLNVQFDLDSVRVVPCVEHMARVPDRQRARLGRETAQLGRNVVLGERVHDRAGAFRIEIGPLGLEAFRRFLPGGADLARLVRLVRVYVRDPLDFHVLLRLRAEEVPALKLLPREPQPLGHLSWIRPTGRVEGRSLVSVQRVDPLRQRRAATPPPAPGAAPRPAPPPTPLAPSPRATPRVTIVRR